MANKAGWIAVGFSAAAVVAAGAFMLGVPMFGYKYVGLKNGGAIAESSVDEFALRATHEQNERVRLEAYIDRHNITYNRYGCAYYTYGTNGDIKSPVFTKDGPLCDGPVREPHDADR